MQSINLDVKAKDDRMQDAFKDLEVLMVRAGEMVRPCLIQRVASCQKGKLTKQVKLAQSLSSRLPQTPQNSQEETLLRTSLVQLGLPTPALTQDMVRDDRLYLEGLAKELGVLLVGRDGKNGLMGGRGVVGLDEVWVIWMRARGVGTPLYILMVKLINSFTSA
jgi:ESCRT-II complex subunit VPS36